MAKSTKHKVAPAATTGTVIDGAAILAAHDNGQHAFNPDPECGVCLQAADTAAILAESTALADDTLAVDTGDTAPDVVSVAPVAPVADTAPVVVNPILAAIKEPVYTPPALLTVMRDDWPRTTDDTVRCGTCDAWLSTKRPVETPDGKWHHRVCATQPRAMWYPDMSAHADTPAGTMLPAGPPAGVSSCWGCKFPWKAASRAVMATDGFLYHKLCAEWAGVLPLTVTARAPRAASSGPAAGSVKAEVADLKAQLAAQSAQLAQLLAALAPSVPPVAPVAPEGTPES